MMMLKGFQLTNSSMLLIIFKQEQKCESADIDNSTHFLPNTMYLKHSNYIYPLTTGHN